MARLRLTFEKKDDMRFIGHLDLMKLFQRMVQRSEIPIAYSKGFNPHQLMSIALPLPLGHSGLNELMEIELSEEYPIEKVAATLKPLLPDGLWIKAVQELEEGQKSAAAAVFGAIYEVELPRLDCFVRLDSAIQLLLASYEILINKKTKSGTKETDIRQDIYELIEISTEDQPKIRLIGAAGSTKNLKPESVVTLLGKLVHAEEEGMSKEEVVLHSHFIRKELLLKED